MNSLPDIQAAIAHLSINDARKLSTWLQEYLEIAADVQLEEEPEARHLETLLQQARAEIAARRAKHHHP